MTLTIKNLDAIGKDAIARFPQEACGFVIGGEYWPCANVHETPETHFRIASSDYLRAKAAGGIEMIVHSHPNGPEFPSEADMISQVSSNVPWAIVATDGERVTEPVVWGGEIAPLIGREFMHGVTDCYSLIRDAFSLGKDALKEQGVTDIWPFDPIFLPEVPRADGWWTLGQDLYRDHFEKFGFRVISMDAARPGDVFLASIMSDKLNHGGILVRSDLIAHHKPNRLSGREPAGLWGRAAQLWIRHEKMDELDEEANA